MAVRQYGLACSIACAGLTAACVDSVVAPYNAPTNAQAFDEIWSSVDLRYSFFELRNSNWDSVRVLYRARAIVALNATALARNGIG